MDGHNPLLCAGNRDVPRESLGDVATALERLADVLSRGTDGAALADGRSSVEPGGRPR